MDDATVQDGPTVAVSAYAPADAPGTLDLFLAAVTETAAADYTAAEIDAWADRERRDLGRWDAAMRARGAFVAEIGAELAGFSDVGPEGYVDMMFVAPRFLRRGVARTLIAHGEALARGRGVSELSADVSITARLFFESQGFAVEAQQAPVRRGVTLTNFRMRKPLT
ncbi:GNAT family N-acetyltransferase [Herbiconiux solani]|uniref:GNAT family N-acetyltransferase n=1 Tax=Herbiconiux solani TaxID=661329 RepID=UPI000825D270|nr:GNAT family N-acetyltransferase [Herbiconiux solani]